MTTEKYIDFAFYERDSVTTHADGSTSVEPGMFTMKKKRSSGEGLSDLIIFLETATGSEDTVITWYLTFDQVDFFDEERFPVFGDTAFVYTQKPFMHWDKFVFTTHTEFVDSAEAKAGLDDIKVVPNPYIVANSWEPVNTYASGRGPQELHFIHLPAQCTIRIFNIRGKLVETLEHHSSIDDGTCIWDMQTRDDLRIAFGVYVYHVDAGKLGQKIGKFAVIR
jgi:hypothetical protein